MKKVSIIIPVYNAEKYVEKCLRSLSGQTYPNIEIICINDGSTDRSLEILQTYKETEPRLKIINQKNGGPGVARNKGLAEATGDYIMFCDSDDWFAPESCETIIPAFNDPDVDIVTFQTQVVDEGECRRWDGEVEYYKNTLSGIHEVTQDLGLKINGVLWNKAFKKSLIDKYQMEFPEIYHGEDSGFIHQYIIICKKINYIENKLYNYLRRSDSIVGQYFQKKYTPNIANDVANRNRVLYKFLEKNNLLDKFANYFMTSVFAGVYYQLQNIHPDCVEACLQSHFALAQKLKLQNLQNLTFENALLRNSLLSGDAKKLQKAFNFRFGKRIKFLGFTIFKLKNIEGYRKISLLGIPFKYKLKKPS